MNEKERQDIERDARRDVAARPNRPGRHEAVITRFVGAMLYGKVAKEPRRPEERRAEEK
jgi:hypothetical protein